MIAIPRGWQLGAALIAGVLMPLSASAQPEQSASVETEQGRVAGFAMESGVQAWLGIPYAQPPVGDGRWKPPIPAAKHAGTLFAQQFAPSCMQPLRDHMIAYYVGDDPIAEDCLYLNVWAPSGTQPSSKLPVIVYIHGGSFVAGSGRKPLYVGDRLAEQGAVVVSINYRLGRLGFFAHPELSAEASGRGSGNYGLMDQIEALRWVRANVAGFGGDANNVTIMGQSAGAMALSVLQVSPKAQGLFTRIVAMSGSLYQSQDADRSVPLEQAEQNGAAFQSAVGAKSLADLRRMPPDQIIAKQAPLAAIVVDGNVLPASPIELYKSGKAADVPILMGVVRDEGGLTTVKDLAGYKQALRTRYGDRAGRVEALYPARDDAQARAAANGLGHDVSFSAMMLNWAGLAGRYGHAPVYGYLFDRSHPYTPGVRFSDLDPTATGVNHTDEVSYWLGTFDSFNLIRPTRAWTQADLDLGLDIRRRLVAFARSGDPNLANSKLRWPVFDSRGQKILRLAVQTQLDTWARADRIKRLIALGPPVDR
jgi:para-nitrobenzyl esterase